MGDPRRTKNKYDTPIHPWEKLRLEAEKPLMKEYGLVNKKELWKVSSKLKNFKDTAKMLVASKTSQAEAEKLQMVNSMKSYGLISSDELDEILGLGVESLLNRRLQTLVFKKGLARSIKQARQMITHRHIAVNGVRITAPGYLVKVSEQDSVDFIEKSKFSVESHPERVIAGASEEVKEEIKKVAGDEPKKALDAKEVKSDVKKTDDKESEKEVKSDVKKESKAEKSDVKKTDDKESEKEVKSDVKKDDSEKSDAKKADK